MFKNDWFEDRMAIKAPPLEAVLDCSGPGRADDAVAYWVAMLAFDGPSWHIRDYLKGFGAWDAKELCNHYDNLCRVFWVYCNDLKEQYNLDEYCGDGEEDKDLPSILYLGS